jgi:hypothetical protein
LQPVVRADPAAIHPYFAAAKHAIDMAFRHAAQRAQQEVVDPLGRAFLADFHGGCPRLV